MVQWIRAVGSWATVRDMARNTVNKDGLGEGAEVSQRFRRAMLIAEHSPIRTLRFNFLLTIKSWISVHFVRHKIGVEHFVTTQRDDRTGVSRDDKPQAALVNHCMDANAQALIAISRKRLCLGGPHRETRAEWLAVKDAVATIDPDVADAMVPECIYRGFCPETQMCKEQFVHTPKFVRDLGKYRSMAGNTWQKE